MTEDGGPPSAFRYDEEVDPAKLDPRHRSFRLDATPLSPFPAPPP